MAAWTKPSSSCAHPSVELTVRLPQTLCERIRAAPALRNLKITDLVFAEIDHQLPLGQEPDLARASTSAPLALAKIDLEERSLELKLRLKGKSAVDLLDYKRAHQALNDQELDLEVLVQSMLARFMETDKGFQAWRKAQPPNGAAS